MRVSYLLSAIGMDSVDGAPLPGTLLAGVATFDVGPADLAVLPALRRWVREHGGTVQSESGAPAPVRAVEPARLYVLSLGARPVAATFTNWSRTSGPCPGCGLALGRVIGEDPASSTAGPPARRVVQTTRAAWLAAPDLVGQLRRAGLADGLASISVALRGGRCEGLWPDRLLASAWPPDGTTGAQPRRCATCLRLLRTEPEAPVVEWLPPYATALHVEVQPGHASPRGWWWHARLGQHLPIVSGDVVDVLRSVVTDVVAIPVATKESEAFLPEEYRGE